MSDETTSKTCEKSWDYSQVLLLSWNNSVIHFLIDHRFLLQLVDSKKWIEKSW